MIFGPFLTGGCWEFGRAIGGKADVAEGDREEEDEMSLLMLDVDLEAGGGDVRRGPPGCSLTIVTPLVVGTAQKFALVRSIKLDLRA